MWRRNRFPTCSSLLPGENLALACSLGVILILFATFAFRMPAVHDEATNHLPLAKEFSAGFPVFADTYISAYTPLPYVIVGKMLNLFGPHIWVARLYNLMIGIIGLFGFRYLLRSLRVEYPGWALLVFALSPYYLRNCVLFYMGNNAIVWAVWGLGICLRRRGSAHYALGAFLFGLGTLSGQYAIPVVAGLALAEMVGLTAGDSPEGRNLNAVLRRLFLLGVFQLPAVLLFYGWHGFTHPNYYAHSLQFTGAHLTGVFSVLGFAFFFWILPQLRSYRLESAVLFAAAIPLFLYSLPVFSIEQGPDNFPGIVSRLVGGVSLRLGFDAPVLFVPFAALGVAGLVSALGERSQETLGLRYASVLMLVALVLSTRVGESNVSSVIPFLLAIVCLRSVPACWRLALTGQTAGLGIGYVLYVVLWKFAHWDAGL